MYTREITAAPQKLIQNGKPVFGTFDTLPKKLDIKGVTTPYAGVPYPPILSRLRIRARAVYVFSVGDYVGLVQFFDNKILNMAEFSLWNTRRGTKYVYRKFLGVRRKMIPTKLDAGRCSTRTPGRRIRFSWNHKSGRLLLAVNVRGLSHRPEIKIFAQGNFKDPAAKEIISVKPAPTMRRCSATWYASVPATTKMEVKGVEKIAVENVNGNGLLFVNRAYYKFITRGESLMASGVIDGKRVSLRISTTSLDAAATGKYNDNVLFVDGAFTPLPPVCITHPFGIAKDWIAQDYESMVDLSFVPQNSYSRKANFILVNAAYDTVFGFLNGTVACADGSKIELRDFPAVAQISKIRL
ncbi:MAG: DUF2804 family protein [Treponema sp.]|nr:DUF2804 family protein [Treponema sp.]